MEFKMPYFCPTNRLHLFSKKKKLNQASTNCCTCVSIRPAGWSQNTFRSTKKKLLSKSLLRRSLVIWSILLHICYMLFSTIATFLPFPFYRELEQKSTLWKQHHKQHKQKEKALGLRKCCSLMKTNLRYLDVLFHSLSKSVYTAAVLLPPSVCAISQGNIHTKKLGNLCFLLQTTQKM